LGEIHRIHENGELIPPEMLVRGGQLTLANKAIFDADHTFQGCIPGISYVLHRQGLMANVTALDRADQLSPGQTERIDEIIRLYPHLTDDEFVAANLSSWLEA
jgi:hypothetical protein